MFNVSEPTELQNELQYYAAQGFLSCKDRQRIFNLKLISMIALNILSVAATAAAGALKLSKAVSLLIGIGSFGLLVYNISSLYYRVRDKIEADRWRPIFEDITNSKFSEAHSKVNTMLQKFEINNELKYPDQNMVVEDPRLSFQVNSPYVHSATAVLQALVEISSGQKYTDDDLKNRCNEIKKWATHIRCSEVTNQWCKWVENANGLDNNNGIFPGKPVKPSGSFLLLNVVKTIKNSSSFSDDSFHEDPSYWGGGAWDRDGKSIIDYVKLIQRHEKNITPQEDALIESFLKCKNLKEIWEVVRDIPEETMSLLEANSPLAE